MIVPNGLLTLGLTVDGSRKKLSHFLYGA